MHTTSQSRADTGRYLHFVGLDHRRAGVARLEQLYDQPGLTDALRDAVLRTPHTTSLAVLQTCNRLELYVASADRDPEPLVRAVAGALGDQLTAAALRSASHAAALTHLFRVAAGLESMVIGEDQILAQVRAATVVPDDQGPHALLSTALQHAIRLGKRVRTETAINAAGRSTASAGLDLLARQGIGIGGARALVLGAGAMGAVVAKALRDNGVGELTIANRDPGRAERLAANYDARAVDLDTGLGGVCDVDIVVTCLGPGAVLGAGHFAAATAPVGVLDLGMPRNVAPQAAALDLVHLVDLQVIAEHQPAAGPAAVAAAETLVDLALTDFDRATATRLIAPTIHRFRATASEALAGEIARLDGRIPDLEPEVRAELHNSMRRLVEKVLHQPTVRAKAVVSEPGGRAHMPVIEQILAAS